MKEELLLELMRICEESSQFYNGIVKDFESKSVKDYFEIVMKAYLGYCNPCFSEEEIRAVASA
jgi:hypothetical protein